MTPLLHISFNHALGGQTWKPQLPAGSDLPPGEYPEPNTPRISMSESISGAFRAIYPNVSKYFEQHNYPYMGFSVYMPTHVDKLVIKPKAELIAERLVWDAHATEESWLLAPTLMRHIGRIKILNSNASPTLLTHPFGDRTLPKRSVGPSEIRYTWVTPQLK